MQYVYSTTDIHQQIQHSRYVLVINRKNTDELDVNEVAFLITEKVDVVMTSGVDLSEMWLRLDL